VRAVEAYMCINKQGRVERGETPAHKYVHSKHGQRLTASHCANELPEDGWVTESTKTEGESIGGGGERVGVANFLCWIHFRL